ncbi:MAG: SOS response-associated peptidase [Candidatus Hinthialibacter antarcticus]|nr:SOS response-associated peptidase [Candidatus Hinthialibacter antarcticus]
MNCAIEHQQTMCGRFTLFSKLDLIKILYQYLDETGQNEHVPSPEEWEEIVRRHTSYNIAPSQEALVIRNGDNNGEKQLASLKWGLVPAWAKDLKQARKPINARAETVAESGMFRGAFKSRRCLVPSSGFYEWKKLDAKTKQPHFIRMKSEEPLLFAGLWERWRREDDELQTFTIITTEPNEVMAPIHNRMPVILNQKECKQWLDPDANDSAALKALLKPYPADEMEAYPVNPAVNSPRNNQPECTTPFEPQNRSDERLF